MRVLQGVMMAAVFASSVHAQSSGAGRKQAVSGTTPQMAQADQASKQKKGRAEKARPSFKWVNPLPESSVPGLEHATFISPSLGNDVGYLILFPAGYERTQQRYPVVYYLHGGRPGNESKSHRLAALIQSLMKSTKLWF